MGKTVEVKKAIPVVVFEMNPNQVGDGLHSMVAYFLEWGVEVPFAINTQGDDEHLHSVGEPAAREQSRHFEGVWQEDFSRSYTRLYDREPIIHKAEEWARAHGRISDQAPSSG